MGILQIRNAVRAGARTLSVLAGVSGSGKTLSALYLAYGMANFDASKIGFLDTENKRGSLYADALAKLPAKPSRKPFLIADLAAPFSPDRYMSSIHEFQSAGVEVLVIDSGTHEWEGVGGCDDIANAPDSQGRPPKMPRWNKAKREHRRFMNALLQSDMHIVVCLRAREKVKIEGAGLDAKFISQGIQPVCEKNFMFEATLSLLMHDMGSRYDLTKVPYDLRPHFPGNKHITPDAGAAIRRWVDSGADVDPKAESWKNRLRTNTEQGEDHVKACWLKVPEEMRATIGDGFYQTLLASAREFDNQRNDAQETPDPVRDVNERIAGLTPEGMQLDWGKR